MKLYKTIRPTEAEVRKNSKWIVYDAISIRNGDIIRLNDGDIVPADVVVLSLGMDFVHVPTDDELLVDDNYYLTDNESEKGKHSSTNSSNMFVEELIVDSSNVNGYAKPQTISIGKNGMIHGNGNGNTQQQTLYAGSIILQGCCIAVVTKTGSETLLGTLIRKGKWPPKQQITMGGDGNYELVEQSEVI